jgi:hypothetical protein
MSILAVGLLLATASTASPGRPAASTRSVCSLLEASELEKIQSGSFVESKDSVRPERGFEARQCFYRLEPFARSVSLEVTSPDPSRPAERGIAERWGSMFHDDKREERRHGEEEEEKSSSHPNAVPGLGREAFWLPNRRSGALYVLGDGLYLRVSVGGGDPAKSQIEKCRRIAEKALAKLESPAR